MNGKDRFRYGKSALEVNKLHGLMREICQKSGLIGNYTTHSGKRTCATALYQAVIDEKKSWQERVTAPRHQTLMLLLSSYISFFVAVKTLAFDISHALAPPDFISTWKPIKAYCNPEVNISHGLNELPLKVEVQVKVFDTFLNKDMWFLATGSAQRGNDNTLPFGGVLYVYDNETIKIMAPGPKYKHQKPVL
ncbi:unnamed protein product [Mytilus coruscus]|uniref:Uncharacterized protein n=1 Tax=Mytilus coruscus TaxID=42192 RepID=A0A6J8B1G2_MYTCO|nr:unnamed protein product [Mytilus coruscus]